MRSERSLIQIRTGVNGDGAWGGDGGGDSAGIRRRTTTRLATDYGATPQRTPLVSKPMRPVMVTMCNEKKM